MEQIFASVISDGVRSGKEQTMRYENMPKGRNKDICVRCGKRANFADRLKSDVQYDLLCLAETTSSGYMTHGNVKLCGKCMSELLMWLDADDFCSYGNRSEKPNNCEPQTYVINPQEPTNDDKCFECDDFFTCGGQCNKIEDEPMKTTDYCDICKRDMCEDCIADATNPYCVPSHYEINYEPKDELTISKMEQVEEPERNMAEDIVESFGFKAESYRQAKAKTEPQAEIKGSKRLLKGSDEPQQKSCATCKHALGNWDGESNNCGRCCGADRRFYEPKDEPQTETKKETQNSNLTFEKQTDCPWK